MVSINTLSDAINRELTIYSQSVTETIKSEAKSHNSTTLLLFTVRNEAGSLARAIDVIGKHGFNLKSLRSRPMKDLLWQYYFYVEAEGNLNTPEGKEMMAELGEYCDKLKSAGTFIKS